MYELKIYRGVIYRDNEEWFKIWGEIDLFQNWHHKLKNVDPSTQLSQTFARLWAPFDQGIQRLR